MKKEEINNETEEAREYLRSREVPEELVLKVRTFEEAEELVDKLRYYSNL